jgi:hypothetical protein
MEIAVTSSGLPVPGSGIPLIPVSISASSRRATAF